MFIPTVAWTSRVLVKKKITDINKLFHILVRTAKSINQQVYHTLAHHIIIVIIIYGNVLILHIFSNTQDHTVQEH